jgi:hypothetical protein
MITIALLTGLANAEPQDEEMIVTRGLIFHTEVLPSVMMTPIPWLRNDHCLFSLVTTTDHGPITMIGLDVLSGQDKVLHNIPTGKRVLPATPGSYTWESIVLLDGSAVLRVKMPQQSAQVSIAMIAPGSCVVQSVVQEEK